MSGDKLAAALASMRTGEPMTEANLSDCALTELPPEVFLPHMAEHLQLLNLSGNRLRTLPPNMPSLRKLRILFCAGNEFESVPDCLGDMPSLRMLSFKENKLKTLSERCLCPSLNWLILTSNELEHLPRSLGNCTGMRKLMLSMNRLQSLPDEMRALDQLELIRLAGNRLATLPAWLLRLPRLSWVAFAGNPASEPPAEAPVRSIDWTDVTLRHVIGEGASGTVHACDCRGFPTPVAIKLFKSEGNSDGLPADEMRASVAAAGHPNCLQVLGRVTGAPKPALLLPLVPPSFVALGKPPSFDTITRDTFPSTTRLSLASILRIVQGIAAVVMHLHARGIMHGDLYAHNILVDEIGTPMLLDFGAATFFSPELLPVVDKVEVRAFGCLIDDLVSIADEESKASSQAALRALAELSSKCWLTDLSARIGFKGASDEIHRIIASSVLSE